MGRRFGEMPDDDLPDDDLVDDDLAVDPIDDQLRAEFTAAFPEVGEPRATFAELRPAFAAARRRHLVGRARTAAAAGIVLVGGLAVLQGAVGSPATDQLVAGPASEATAPTDRLSSSSTSNETDGIGPADPGDETSLAPPVQAQEDRPDSDATIAAPTTTAGSDTAAAPEGSVSPSATAPTTMPSTAAPPAPTDPLEPELVTVESDCGSIVVEVVGRDVELVEVFPSVAGAPDVKNAGPEAIEVSFEGAGRHCELKAEWRNGELWTYVDQEGDGDGDG